MLQTNLGGTATQRASHVLAESQHFHMLPTTGCLPASWHRGHLRNDKTVVKAVKLLSPKEVEAAKGHFPALKSREPSLTELSIPKLLSKTVNAAVGGLPTKKPDPTSAPPQDPKNVHWPPKRPFVSVAIDNLLDSARLHPKHTAPEASSPWPLGTTVVSKKGTAKPKEATKKPVVLVLGSGWGAHALCKDLDPDAYDVVAVSPRNHFVFTPMLPALAVGTVEFRSLLDPVRQSSPNATYFEASCDAIDLRLKLARCSSTFAYEDGRKDSFEVAYDTLVVAVGEQPATFGIKGVAEHCYFMKEVSDAVDLRGRIGQCFELANLPTATDADKRKLLHFVVVGGGPTGVEFAGTLEDFIHQDLRKKYPQLMQHIQVTLLETTHSILTVFDKEQQQDAIRSLQREGVNVRLGAKVVEVTQDQVLLDGGDCLDYGLCLWSAGNCARPLVRDLVAAIPEQAGLQRSKNPVVAKLAVDPFLRVVGAEDVFALGDCALLVGGPLPPTGQVAAQEGEYLGRLLNGEFKAGKGGMHEAPPARLVSTGKSYLPPLPAEKSLVSFFMGGQERQDVGAEVAGQLAVLTEAPWAPAARAASAAIEVEAVEGAQGDVQPLQRLEFHTRPFEYLNLGILAYLGDDKALAKVDAFDLSLGFHGKLGNMMWRHVYLAKQASNRNRLLLLFDWFKTTAFGRDLSIF